ncbi:MAG: hypothetical protein Kow0089_11170 [Desulfobulbaceae bacterium]
MSGTENGKNENGQAGEQRGLSRHHLIYYLRVFDGMSSRVVGHIVDISPGGIMLITDEPISPQEEYRLRMRFPGSGNEKRELVLDAVCRWCRQDENPEFYIAGFQITDLSDEDTAFIQSLIAEFGM